MFLGWKANSRKKEMQRPPFFLPTFEYAVLPACIYCESWMYLKEKKKKQGFEILP